MRAVHDLEQIMRGEQLRALNRPKSKRSIPERCRLMRRGSRRLKNIENGHGLMRTKNLYPCTRVIIIDEFSFSESGLSLPELLLLLNGEHIVDKKYKQGGTTLLPRVIIILSNMTLEETMFAIKKFFTDLSSAKEKQVTESFSLRRRFVEISYGTISPSLIACESERQAFQVFNRYLRKPLFMLIMNALMLRTDPQKHLLKKELCEGTDDSDDPEDCF